MRGLKPSLALGTIGIISLALWAGAAVDRPGSAMATAAERFLDALDDQKRDLATFDFGDPERLNWHFIPRERDGLPVKQMSAEERNLAMGLLATGLSAEGAVKATTVMSLEQILHEMENNAPHRDPELYFFSIFGEPSNRGSWGWRVEGHHLSLNFTIEGGEVVSATPAFFGSNPAEVRQGDREGLRALAEVEDRALRLVQALDQGQQAEAIVAEEAPGDVRAANTPQPPAEEAVGLTYGKMTEAQRDLLRTLIEAYAMDMPARVAEAWLTEIRDAGPEKVAFAWFGPADRNQPHAYRVQGPTFLIEFNNTQNNANHIHSIWRSMLGDFGRPIAAE
ncbi:DUF3500 domain-containing protein [Tautonia plasticadhaerens]|uniref:DUF3500 domain-containing protein n=1 Tax=Tautonia plasticadhaerens TaxID=2527974 RepID=A0A518H329_9BACT|nr:DUF3500 domain-containing protein [Tautonia plasticadhaerens]QDV35235.1 hypothetical protein ElP_31380 [Tautonia plasticadhaerens]